MRLIDADELLSDIERTIEESGCVNHEGEIMDCVRYAPTIDAAPVIRGEWKNAYKSGHKPNPENVCSECDCWSHRRSSYCPSCGAKMEDKQ